MSTPFFIAAEVHTGDADGPNKLDLFVVAAGVCDARRMWRDYFRGWDLPGTIEVYSIPTAWSGVQGVIEWQKLPCVRMPA